MPNQKRRTITLTNRAPVSIIESEWPTIAIGLQQSHDGKHAHTADCSWGCSIRVRQHADGRAIVYGVYTFYSHLSEETDIEIRAGELLPPGGDIVQAINNTTAELAKTVPTDHADLLPRVCAKTIASLPVEEL